MNFDESDPAYRCCCSRVRSQKAIFYIVTIEIICAGFKLASVLYELTVLAFWKMSERGDVSRYQISKTLADEVFRNFTIALSIGSLITIATAITLIYGLNRDRYKLMLPHLVWQAMLLVSSLVMSLLAVVVLFTLNLSLTEFVAKMSSGSKEDRAELWIRRRRTNAGETPHWTMILGPVQLLALFLVEFWFFTVCLRAFMYTRDKVIAEKQGRAPFSAFNGMIAGALEGVASEVGNVVLAASDAVDQQNQIMVPGTVIDGLPLLEGSPLPPRRLSISMCRRCSRTSLVDETGMLAIPIVLTGTEEIIADDQLRRHSLSPERRDSLAPLRRESLMPELGINRRDSAMHESERRDSSPVPGWQRRDSARPDWLAQANQMANPVTQKDRRDSMATNQLRRDSDASIERTNPVIRRERPDSVVTPAIQRERISATTKVEVIPPPSNIHYSRRSRSLPGEKRNRNLTREKSNSIEKRINWKDGQSDGPFIEDSLMTRSVSSNVEPFADDFKRSLSTPGVWTLSV